MMQEYSEYPSIRLEPEPPTAANVRAVLPPQSVADAAVSSELKAVKVARIVFLVLAIAGFAGRALHTATVYNHTFDEPTQIASGLELLEYGTFELHNDVPPLAKLLLAAPVYFEGVRLAHPPRRGNLEDANEMLYRGNYWQTLRSARAMSTLVGTVLLIAIYLGASHLFGPWPGAIAAAVASVSPGLVSAASIANSDMLSVLTMLLALFTWRRLIERGGRRHVTLFALALSTAVLAKLSALPFLAFSLPVMTIWLLGWRALEPVRAPVRWLRAHGNELVLFVAIVPLALWAAYGFQRGPISGTKQAQITSAWLEQRSPAVAEIFRQITQQDLPLGSFIRGMGTASRIASQGHPAYLMGEQSLHGWPHYFLVTLALKIPIGILVAVLATLVLALRMHREPVAREVLLLAPLAAAILASVAYAGINAGHRHIVVVEALFALMAGGGVALALAKFGWLRRIALAVFALCLGAGALSSLRAHPDALGYTNAFAGTEPDWWFVDSNLDWGQDLERLRKWLDAQGVKEPVHLAYFGSADPARHGITFQSLAPGDKATGWVAVSVHYERGMAGSGIGKLGSEIEQNGYTSFLQLRPETQIGTSIRVYHLSPTPTARSSKPEPATS
jgi:dolichyl-phosphate-mannose-protein mannosyltransferase